LAKLEPPAPEPPPIKSGITPMSVAAENNDNEIK
jgi:hypothetical protein